MSRIARFALPVIAALALGSAALAAGLPAQTSNQGGVTIKVTPLGFQGPAWDFDVMLETHTQNLEDDLAKSSTLFADGKHVAPTSWKGDPPGGHHRKGVLRFDAMSPAPASVELQIARPGEAVPRAFRWTLR